MFSREYPLFSSEVVETNTPILEERHNGYIRNHQSLPFTDKIITEVLVHFLCHGSSLHSCRTENMKACILQHTGLHRCRLVDSPNPKNTFFSIWRKDIKGRDMKENIYREIEPQFSR